MIGASEREIAAENLETGPPRTTSEPMGFCPLPPVFNTVTTGLPDSSPLSASSSGEAPEKEAERKSFFNLAPALFPIEGAGEEGFELGPSPNALGKSSPSPS